MGNIFLSSLTNVLTISLLFILINWNLPSDMPAKMFLNKYSRLIYKLGLQHNWSLFAPNPVSVNKNIEIIVHYPNNESQIWKLPGLTEIDGHQRVTNVRVAKIHHQLLTENDSFFKKSFSKHILSNLKESKSESYKAPLKIEYYVYYKKTATPGSNIKHREWIGKKIYQYKVTAQDLL